MEENLYPESTSLLDGEEPLGKQGLTVFVGMGGKSLFKN